MSIQLKKHHTKTTIFVFLLAFACAFMWGSSFPIIKYGFKTLNIQNNTSAKLYFAAYRFFLAGFIIFSLLKIKNKKVLLSKKKDYFYLTIVGLSQTTILYSFFYIGLSNTSGVKASIITASGSFFLAILSHFLIKNDNLTIRKVIGLILGFMGILLINIKNFTPDNFSNCFKINGEILILLGTLSSALGNITVKHIVGRINPLLICAYQFTIGSIVLFFISYMIEKPNLNILSNKAIFLITILALISAAAFSIWYLLIKNNPLSNVAIYRFLIPLCGTLFSTIFIDGESLNLVILGSLFLVCIGIIFTNGK